MHNLHTIQMSHKKTLIVIAINSTIDINTEELCIEPIVFLLLRLILNEQNMLAG